MPFAAWLGQQFGWRAAFIFVAAVAVVAALSIHRVVPDLPPDVDASPMRELGGLRRPQVWLTLGIAGIGFGGMFCVFSYIKPTLTEITGVPLAQVPLVLSLFGFGSVAGNLLGARLADRALIAAALNHSAFNFANALGAWLGGLAIAAGLGWTSTGWVGVALALGGLLVFGASLAVERRTRAAAR